MVSEIIRGVWCRHSRERERKTKENDEAKKRNESIGTFNDDELDDDDEFKGNEQNTRNQKRTETEETHGC